MISQPVNTLHYAIPIQIARQIREIPPVASLFHSFHLLSPNHRAPVFICDITLNSGQVLSVWQHEGYVQNRRARSLLNAPGIVTGYTLLLVDT